MYTSTGIIYVIDIYFVDFIEIYTEVALLLVDEVLWVEIQIWSFVCFVIVPQPVTYLYARYKYIAIKTCHQKSHFTLCI